MTITNEQRQQYVRECPEFNYMNTPDGTQEDMRYVFNHKVCLSLEEAYIYALECEQQLANARAIAKATGSVGAISEKTTADGTLLGRGDYNRPAEPSANAGSTYLGASGTVWPM